MQSIVKKLWNDDCGQVALEYMLVLGIVSLGLVYGLKGLELAINYKLTDLADAILTLNFSYSYASEYETSCSGAIIGGKGGSVYTSVAQSYGVTVIPVTAPTVITGTSPACP